MRREIFQALGLLIGGTPCVSVQRVFRCGERNSVETAIPRQNARSKFRKKLYVLYKSCSFVFLPRRDAGGR